MDPSANEADVVLNRLNVALARSQKIIDSWLPPEAQPEEETGDGADEDFKPMAEERGIGFNDDTLDDDESLARNLQRKKRLISNDQLLEQLIGKKAAQAKRKSQEGGKSMSMSKHAAPKPMVSRLRQVEHVESEDEDAGRSAAFKSRKISRKPNHIDADPMAPDHDENGIGDSQTLNSGRPVDLKSSTENAAISTSDPRERKSKSRSNTYLDELLAQKGRKKKKKPKGNVNS